MIFFMKMLNYYVKEYFEKYSNIDFLFGTVEKYKLLFGYNPKKFIGPLVFTLHIRLVFL